MKSSPALSRLGQALKIVSLAALTPLFSHAAVTISTSTGTAMQAPALTGFATTGSDMDGLLVSVLFSNGSTVSASWADTAAGAGAASSAGWFSLSESGDTFGGNWTLQNLSNLSIVGLTLAGAPGNTVFDRSTGFTFDTAGSASGLDFTSVSNFTNAHAHYTNIFNLTGDPAGGDLYETLIVSDFAIAAGGSGIFDQDADNADANRGGITTVPDSGATAMMLGASLLGLMAIRRRKL